MAKQLDVDLKNLYFDDYDPKKKYYRILFKPGRSVQARELNQIQSMIQSQIERIGNNLFLDGANVYPSTLESVKYYSSYNFIKLPANDSSNTLKEESIKTRWLNKTIKNAAGVEAVVYGYRLPDTIGGPDGEIRLFIQYTKGSGTSFSFNHGDVITTVVTSGAGDRAQIPTPTNINATPKVGPAWAVQLYPENIYYYKGFFIYVDYQMLFLAPSSIDDPDPDSLSNQAKWLDPPTGLIGLELSDDVVTFNSGLNDGQGDLSLLDNATGSPNFSAPGGDRLYIDANLVQLPLADVGSNNSQTNLPKNFIRLIQVRRGAVEFLTTYSRQYNILEDTLARRTYDESGDYVVEPFIVHIKNFLARPNLFLDGFYQMSDFKRKTKADAEALALETFDFKKLGINDSTAFQYPYIDGNPTSGTWYPGKSFNGRSSSERPSFIDLCDKFVMASIDPGKAYVKGYEITKLNRTPLQIPKARDIKFLDNQLITTGLGTYFVLTDIKGVPDFGKFTKGYLYKSINTTLNVPNQNSPDVIGKFTAISVESVTITNPDTTTSIQYRLYFTDLEMNLDAQKNPEDISKARSLYVEQNTGGSTAITANIALSEIGIEGSITRINPLTGNPDAPLNNGGEGPWTPGSSAARIYVYGIGTLWKNSTSYPLKKGDYIRIGDTDPTFYRLAKDPLSDTKLEIELVNGTRGVSDPIVWEDTTTGQNAHTKGTAISGTEKIWTNNSKVYVGSALMASDTNIGGFLYQTAVSNVATIRSASTGSTPSPTTNTDIIYTIPYDITYNESGHLKAIPQTGKIVYSASDIAFAGGDTSFAPTSTPGYAVVDSTGIWFKVQSVSDKNAQPSTKGVVNLCLTNDTHGVGELTITFNQGDYKDASGNPITRLVRIIVLKQKSKYKENTKTLKAGGFDSDGKYFHPDDNNLVTPKIKGGVIVINPTLSTNPKGITEITIPVCDVCKITRITTSKSPNDTPSDFTDDPLINPIAAQSWKDHGDSRIDALYQFDNGQTEHAYGYAVLTLKPEYTTTNQRPPGQIRIEFDYLDHGTIGDYFSVDSYISAGLNYDEIPIVTTFEGVDVALSDCLDFRKKIDDLKNNVSDRVFAPVGNIYVDAWVYQARQDKIVLNSDKDNFATFTLVQGKPDFTPVPPQDIPTAMTVCTLKHDPYGFGYLSTEIKMEHNRRYTMKDIGRLEKRIEHLEYYTSLSLLESEASSLAITDANGNTKFKNGFLVDNFSTDIPSDRGNDDYACTLDNTAHECIPLLKPDHIELVEAAAVGNEGDEEKKKRNRADLHYTQVGTSKDGYLFTLPFTRKPFATYRWASKVINVNPFKVVAYRGKITINPWTDEWYETVITNAGNVVDETAYNAAKSMFNGTPRYDAPIVVPGSEHTHYSEYSRVSDALTPELKNALDHDEKLPHRLTANLKVLKAGHRFTHNQSSKSKRGAQKGYVIIPPGWFNSGQLVPINDGANSHESMMCEVLQRTKTVTKKYLRTSSAATFFDKGLSDPILRVINSKLSSIEYMRSREIQFTANCFPGNTTLTATFDNVDVTKDCRPLDNTQNGVVSYTVLQNVANKYQLIGSFSSTPATASNNGSGVRVGCEVDLYKDGVLKRKYNITKVEGYLTPTTATIITLEPKTILGEPFSEDTDNAAIPKDIAFNKNSVFASFTTDSDIITFSNEIPNGTLGVGDVYPGQTLYINDPDANTTTESFPLDCSVIESVTAVFDSTVNTAEGEILLTIPAQTVLTMDDLYVGAILVKDTHAKWLPLNSGHKTRVKVKSFGGGQPINDPTSPNNGKRPVTSIVVVTTDEDYDATETKLILDTSGDNSTLAGRTRVIKVASRIDVSKQVHVKTVTRTATTTTVKLESINAEGTIKATETTDPNASPAVPARKIFFYSPKAFDVKITKYAFGDELNTDGNGKIQGIFKIPDIQTKRFKTGDVLFKLSNASKTSTGSARYTSRGMRENVTVGTVQTRLFDIGNVSDNDYYYEDETSPADQKNGKWEWIDPIAQSFYVEDTCCITDVDVYFFKKPAETTATDGSTSKNSPVQLELRECNSATMPTTGIVGGITLGTVILYPEDVITNNFTYYTTGDDGKLVENSTIPLITDKNSPYYNQNRGTPTALVVTGKSGGAIETEEGEDKGKYYWDKTTTLKADSHFLIDKTLGGGSTTEPIRQGKIYSNKPTLPILSAKDSKKEDVTKLNSMTFDMVPTRFSFPVPLKLESGKHYAIVLSSSSDDYEVWVAQTGTIRPRPGDDVSYSTSNDAWQLESDNDNNVIGTKDAKVAAQDQPLAIAKGDMYIGKNSAGWLIEPTLNLKVVLHKAQFDISSTGEVILVNAEIPKIKLPRDSFEVVKGSGLIRIPYANHGFTVGDKVVLDIDDNLVGPDTANRGVGDNTRGFFVRILENINGHPVVATETDYFVIQVSGSEVPIPAPGTIATSTGKFGGDSSRIAVNKRYEECVLSANQITHNKITEIDYTLTTTSTKGVSDPSPHQPNTKLSPITIIPGKRLVFSTSMRINVPINEPTPSSTLSQMEKIIAKKSMVVKAILQSTDQNLSPVLDTAMLSMGMLTTRLDYPTPLSNSYNNTRNVVNIDEFDNIDILPKNTYNSASNTIGLRFTQSGGNVPGGKFTQEEQSTKLKFIKSGTAGLLGTLKPGDIIVEPDSHQERIIRKVLDDELEINAPFNPGFSSSKYLRTAVQHMVIKTGNPSTAQKLSDCDIGKYVTLTIYDASGAIDNTALSAFQQPKLVLDVIYTPLATEPDLDLGGQPCYCKVVVQHYNSPNDNSNPTGPIIEQRQLQLIQRNRYIDEIAPNVGVVGTASTRYICRTLSLDSASTALRISFDGRRPEGTYFEVYYRTESVQQNFSINQTNWTKAPFNIEKDGSLVQKTPPPGIEFKNYECNVDKLSPFKAVQVKIVMLGGNPADRPAIKNFTLIALAD